MANAAFGFGWDVGIYTNYNHWQTIVGADFDLLSDYPLWWARYNGAADLVSGWSPFAGWDNPTMHQYTQNSVVCNLKLDKSYKNDTDTKFGPKFRGAKLPRKKAL
uniref:Uncharacterized protein n=1 Tax=Panagrolaimus sp. JU765 TaxID=591449 RepID=A0AC34RKQ5_9BILA